MSINRTVALVVADGWERGLIRDGLVERGLQVTPMASLEELVTSSPARARVEPAAIAVDGSLARGREARRLAAVRAHHPAAPLVLLAGGGAPPRGPWSQVLTRPVTEHGVTPSRAAPARRAGRAGRAAPPRARRRSASARSGR